MPPKPDPEIDPATGLPKVDPQTSVNNLMDTPIPAYCDNNDTTTSKYADDVSPVASNRDMQTAVNSLSEYGNRLVDFAAAAGLVINPGKTQFLAPSWAPPMKIGDTLVPPSSTMTVLGSTVDTTFGFTDSNKEMVGALRSRLGAVRRVAAHIPRGKLLQEIAHALIWGKLQQCAWVTRSVRGLKSVQESIPGPDAAAQVVLNDTARLLLHVRRSDHFKAADMAEKLGFMSVNQVVVQQSAVAAWKCANLRNSGSGPLDNIATPVSTTTRAASEGLLRPNSSSTAAKNITAIWEFSPDLRAASTLTEAKTRARELASQAQF